jgi:signal recognition particle receptor subunit beta
MVQFNFSERTIKSKVVYYGPPQSGKTTNLEQIHRLTDPEGANRLISLNTAQDRTLFFDLLPFSLGTVSGYDFKVQLYTVPGQVQYNATRRVVLAGADAVVFVADSQKAMGRDNLTAFENMKVNLLANRLVPEKVPLVLQYNKQDLENLLPLSELSETLNPWGRKTFPAVAARGEGVLETFVAVVQEMLAAIAQKYNLKEKGLDPAAVPDVVAQAFEALLKNRPAGTPKASTPSPPRPGTGTLPPGERASARIAAFPGPTASTPAAPTPAVPAPAAPTPAVLAPAAPTPAGGPRDRPASPVAARAQGALPGSPGKVIFAQPKGAEPAYPGQAGSDASPVSEELLHRAIRSNVELAEALGSFVHEVQLGLGTIVSHADQLTTGGADGRRAEVLVGGIRREVTRLRRVIQELGDAGAGAGVSPAARVPPKAPAGSAPRSSAPPAPPARPPAAGSGAPSSASVAAARTGGAGTLDGLVNEVVRAVHAPLASRGLSVKSHIVLGAGLPRCPPASLKRATAALLQGLAASVASGSKLAVRAERKPVLLRGRNGQEQRRDFLMLAFTHGAGLTDDDQRRILKGADKGRLGEAYRLVREMGGFLRFAPLPEAMLETRVFLPV